MLIYYILILADVSAEAPTPNLPIRLLCLFSTVKICCFISVLNCTNLLIILIWIKYLASLSHPNLFHLFLILYFKRFLPLFSFIMYSRSSHMLCCDRSVRVISVSVAATYAAVVVVIYTICILFQRSLTITFFQQQTRSETDELQSPYQPPAASGGSWLVCSVFVYNFLCSILSYLERSTKAVVEHDVQIIKKVQSHDMVSFSIRFSSFFCCLWQWIKLKSDGGWENENVCVTSFAIIPSNFNQEAEWSYICRLHNL